MAHLDTPLTSLVIVTYNRLGFFQQALTAARERTDDSTEIIVWENASRDGTREWLSTVTDPRVRVIHSDENVGINAYELAFRQARGQWLAHMDNDVLELPDNFISRMIAAFAVCPDLGYLALDVVRDDKTNGGKPEEYAYTEECYDDICLQFGPVGGWCAMTPREVYEQIHFPLVPGETYFYHDGMYSLSLPEIGRRAAILKGVRCYHAAGVWWNARYQEYWEERSRDRPVDLRRMRLFLDKGVLIKDTQRPFSLRKVLGDAKRWLMKHSPLPHRSHPKD